MLIPRIVTVCAAAALLAACETPQQTQTAVGAGAGAATGAVLGSAVGGRRGAAVGTGVGAAAGAAIGYNWQAVRERLGLATKDSGVQVTEQSDGALRVNVPGSVSFATGSATLEPKLFPTLDRIAGTLNEYPETTVTIVGHTDNVGSAQANHTLAFQRATAVADYLAKRGVNRGRMRVESRGEAEPIADNNTEAGRAQNRRVELYVRQAAG